ncbi:hypothetical protein HDU67_005723 [Dinochytrium kinnereticum]|nr:hypothetical protein HDU67_005723 [Dinochytrium kinnereticum]
MPVPLSSTGIVGNPPAFLYQSAVVAAHERGAVYLLGGTIFGKVDDKLTVNCNTTVYVYYPEIEAWNTTGIVMPVGLVIGGSQTVPTSDPQAQDAVSDTIFALDLITEVWTSFSTSNTSISRRYNHVSVHNGTGIYLFGGRSSFFNVFDDLVFVTTPPTVTPGPGQLLLSSTLPITNTTPRTARALGSGVLMTGLEGRKIAYAYGGFNRSRTPLSVMLQQLRGEDSWFAWDPATGEDVSFNNSYFGYEGFQFPDPPSTTTTLLLSTSTTLPTSSSPPTGTLTLRSTTTNPLTLTSSRPTATPFPLNDMTVSGPTFNASSYVANFAFTAVENGTLAYLYGGGAEEATASSDLWVLNATVPGRWDWRLLSPGFLGEGEGGEKDVGLPKAFSAGSVVFGGRVIFFIPYAGNTTFGGLVIYHPANDTFTRRNTTKSAVVPTPTPTSTPSDSSSSPHLLLAPSTIAAISIASAVILLGAVALILWINVGKRKRLSKRSLTSDNADIVHPPTGEEDGESPSTMGSSGGDATVAGGGVVSAGQSKSTSRSSTPVRSVVGSMVDGARARMASARVRMHGDEAEEMIPMEQLVGGGTASSSRTTLPRACEEGLGGSASSSSSLERGMGRRQRQVSGQSFIVEAEVVGEERASRSRSETSGESFGSGRSSTSLSFMASYGTGLGGGVSGAGGDGVVEDTLASWLAPPAAAVLASSSGSPAPSPKRSGSGAHLPGMLGGVANPVMMSGPPLAGGFRPPNRTVTASHLRGGGGGGLTGPQTGGGGESLLSPPPSLNGGSGRNPGGAPGTITSTTAPLAAANAPPSSTHLSHRHSHHHIHATYHPLAYHPHPPPPPHHHHAHPHIPTHHSHPHLPMLDTQAPPSYEDATFTVAPSGGGGGGGGGVVEPVLSPEGGEGREEGGGEGEEGMRGPDGEEFEGRGRVVIPHVPVGKEEIELRVGDVVGVYRRADPESTQSMVRGYNFNSGRTGLFPIDSIVRFPPTDPNATPTDPTDPTPPTNPTAAANLSWWRRQAVLAFAGITGGGGTNPGTLGAGGDEEDAKRATEEITSMVHGRMAAARLLSAPLHPVVGVRGGVPPSAEVEEAEVVVDAIPIDTTTPPQEPLTSQQPLSTPTTTHPEEPPTSHQPLSHPEEPLLIRRRRSRNTFDALPTTPRHLDPVPESLNPVSPRKPISSSSPYAFGRPVTPPNQVFLAEVVGEGEVLVGTPGGVSEGFPPPSPPSSEREVEGVAGDEEFIVSK